MANYIPVSKIGVDQNGLTVFINKKKCESFYSEKCGKIPYGYNAKYHRHTDEMINDPGSPIWEQRSMVESCAGEESCKFVIATKECINGRHALYDDIFTEAWCNKITGYNKKKSGKKITVEDQGLKAAYVAQKQVIKSAKASRRAIIKALKDKLSLDQDLNEAELREVLKYLIKD